MHCNRFGTSLLLSIATLAVPLAASASPSKPSRTIVQTAIAQAQAEPTARQVLDACVQNRAATLPNPFVDVPANHWAFTAVLTMHYCGAYRQVTPSSLMERLTTEPTAQPAPMHGSRE